MAATAATSFLLKNLSMPSQASKEIRSAGASHFLALAKCCRLEARTSCFQSGGSRSRRLQGLGKLASEALRFMFFKSRRPRLEVWPFLPNSYKHLNQRHHVRKINQRDERNSLRPFAKFCTPVLAIPSNQKRHDKTLRASAKPALVHAAGYVFMTLNSTFTLQCIDRQLSAERLSFCSERPTFRRCVYMCEAVETKRAANCAA